MTRERQSREARVIGNCQVRFRRLDDEVVAETEDFSSRGVFVRTQELLPVGAVVNLTLTLNDKECTVVSRVAHLLSPSLATNLGRSAGMGFEFLDVNEESADRLQNFIEGLRVARGESHCGNGMTIVLFDPNRGLRERVTLALIQEGYGVSGFEDLADAVNQCRYEAPDVIIVAFDEAAAGVQFVRACKSTASLEGVPVIGLGNCDSMARLEAFEQGLDSLVPKPFTDAELSLRVAQALENMVPTSPGSTLRGGIKDISVATLLSILQCERKSGIVWLTKGSEQIRLYVREGEILRATGRGESDIQVVLDALSLDDGVFEFNGCEVAGDDHIKMTLQQLLLSHAQGEDEQREIFDDASASQTIPEFKI